MTVHFLGGLPRSCSTALASIISQNPSFYASATSPLISIVEASRESRTTLAFKALKKSELDARMPHVFRGILEGWYAAQNEEHCFDKCRGWLGRIDLLNSLYESPKIIVPIRDVRGIVASMEKLYRKNPGIINGIIDRDKLASATIQGRVDAYLKSPVLGMPINMLFEAFQRNQLSECLVVRAEDLTLNPEMQMRKLHAFLGLKYYAYDFNKIKSSSWENDAVHEPFGEHEVKPSLTPLSENWDDILTPAVSQDIKERCAWFYEAFYPDVI